MSLPYDRLIEMYFYLISNSKEPFSDTNIRFVHGGTKNKKNGLFRQCYITVYKDGERNLETVVEEITDVLGSLW